MIMGGDGYLFRDESLLQVEGDGGIVCDLVHSGEKVSKDVALTEVWEVADAAQIPTLQNELDRLNRLIAVLQDSRLPADTTLSKAEAFRKAAQAEYLELRLAISRGEWTGLRTRADEMLTLLNRYTALVGDAQELEGTLQELQKKKAELLTGGCQTLYNTRASGYFYSREYVDGYETLFKPDAISDMTMQELTALIGREGEVTPGASVVGKMVYGNRWYLAVLFEPDTADFFTESERYDFVFPENRDRVLSLTCVRIAQGDDAADAVFFSCDEVPTDFVFYRSQRVEITVGSHTGYYVPDSALRVVGGVEGVYIFENSTVYFRRVKILYRGDGYCVVAEQGDLGSDYLAFQDILVTAGENLYDGRVFE